MSPYLVQVVASSLQELNTTDFDHPPQKGIDVPCSALMISSCACGILLWIVSERNASYLETPGHSPLMPPPTCLWLEIPSAAPALDPTSKPSKHSSSHS